MNDDQLKTACCAGASDEERAEAEASFAIAKAWLIEHPVAVGGSAHDLEKHLRKCQRYVVDQRQQTCGFAFAPGLLYLIYQVVSTLFLLWWK